MYVSECSITLLSWIFIIRNLYAQHTHIYSLSTYMGGYEFNACTSTALVVQALNHEVRDLESVSRARYIA